MVLTPKEKIAYAAFRHFPTLASRIFNKGYFHKAKFLNLLPKDPIIFDIGAADGTEAILFRALFPNATIHCFEPEPSNYKILLSKTNGLNINSHQIALGSKNGKTCFYASYGPTRGDSSSLKKPNTHLTLYPEIKFKEIEIDVIRPETWLKKNSIKKIDLLWMDVQGAELEILKSFGKALDSVKVIHSEVTYFPYYENVPLYDEFKEFLEKKGFDIFEIIKENSTSHQGDVVFVNHHK